MKIDLSGWYKFLSPRAVVLVATRDNKGNSNAAPFSFVMPASVEPPLIAFCSDPEHDTVANIRQVGDFTVNVPGSSIVCQLWQCAQDYPHGVSEIEKSKLTEISMDRVRSPGISESIAIFGCTLYKEYPAGDHVLFLGEIVSAIVKDEFMKDKSYDINKASPLLHVGASKFTTPGSTINI